MPRKRPKTRVEHLADALEDVLRAQEALEQIDLRSTNGSLRDLVRQARDGSTSLRGTLEGALRADAPPAPRARASV